MVAEYVRVPRVFMDTLAMTAGTMVNGNRLSEEAKGILRAAELDATPPAGAGEAVAFRFLALVGYANAWSRWFGIDELHHYGVDGNLTPGPSPAWSRVEYAYAAPTPLPEAVRELPAKWRAEADWFAAGANSSASAAHATSRNKCADELDRALTGGDKQGDSNG